MVSATLIGIAAVLAAWTLIVLAVRPDPWILPDPLRVARALHDNAGYLAEHAAATFLEMALGLLLGTCLGVATALLMSLSESGRRLGMPLLVASQALPVFAIAPLLVLWLGYGMASKVAMASLIIYFPVASAFLDGLLRTDPALLDLARLHGASPLDSLRLVRVPAAVPSLVSGVRVAAAVAPIGAVVGEWVGSSAGLGYVMLHANARVQTDLVFAALFVLLVAAVALRAAVDALARRLTRWLPQGT